MTVQPDAPERRRTPRPLTLPPAGTTPAGDLQRRIADAALRGFYAPKAARVPRVNARVWSVLLICAASWSAVFGLGAVLVG
jgi:hypothetical protein